MTLKRLCLSALNFSTCVSTAALSCHGNGADCWREIKTHNFHWHDLKNLNNNKVAFCLACLKERIKITFKKENSFSYKVQIIMWLSWTWKLGTLCTSVLLEKNKNKYLLTLRKSLFKRRNIWLQFGGKWKMLPLRT